MLSRLHVPYCAVGMYMKVYMYSNYVIYKNIYRGCFIWLSFDFSMSRDGRLTGFAPSFGAGHWSPCLQHVQIQPMRRVGGDSAGELKYMADECGLIYNLQG